MMELPFESIHIAGTNGKGSTAAFAGAVLRVAGHTCGVYTSPHVVRPSERISVNGEDIPENALERLLNEQRQKGAATFFHAYTSAAFEWFIARGVDFAVLETGLGGRLDPTNTADARACILTSIGIDHTHILGSDIEKIAVEKCGILQPGIPVFTCEQRPRVMAVIRRECAEKGCPLYVVRPEDIRIKRRTIEGQWFDFTWNGRVYEDLHIRLLGMRQPQNACLAAVACLHCGAGEEAVRNGLAQAQMISRFEYFAGTPPIILDGAHNVDSAQELCDTLQCYFGGKDIVLLTAVMADKDIPGILGIFASFAKEAVAVRADETRGEKAENLARILRGLRVEAQSAESVEEAFGKARVIAAQKNALLVVSGSFYLTGRVRQYCLIQAN